MQLIAGLYKGLFISQRVTKRVLSKSSLGLLHHHPGQDHPSIIWMCQNNIHHPFLRHVCSTQAPSHRGVQGDDGMFPARDRAAHVLYPGMKGDLLCLYQLKSSPGWSTWLHPRNTDMGWMRSVETRYATSKSSTGISELVERLCCHRWTNEATTHSSYPPLSPAN